MSYKYRELYSPLQSLTNIPSLPIRVCGYEIGMEADPYYFAPIITDEIKNTRDQRTDKE